MGSRERVGRAGFRPNLVNAFPSFVGKELRTFSPTVFFRGLLNLLDLIFNLSETYSCINTLRLIFIPLKD